MNAPMDPMSQYDPATEAMITGQMSPQHKVAQALMGQGGGGGIGGLSSMLGGALMPLLMSFMKHNPKSMNPILGSALGGGVVGGASTAFDPVMGTGTPPMSPVPVSPMDQASSLSSSLSYPRR